MLTQSDLDQFTGTEKWFRHGLVPSVHYTEGVKYMADEGGAHWLIDKIATIGTMEKSVAKEVFQSWKLRATGENKARLTADDGNGKVLYMEDIEFTDFPLAGIDLYLIRDGMPTDTILLPSEY